MGGRRAESEYRWKDPLPVAKLAQGGERRVACPKCGHRFGPHAWEPCFDHCFMCGSLWPIAGTALKDQYAFELSSGLAVHADESLMHHKYHVKRHYVNGDGKRNGTKAQRPS